MGRLGLTQDVSVTYCDDMSTQALASVARAARVRANADEAFRAAIRAAAEAGESFRVIAGAAGISHEQVRRICKERNDS
jgi:hypothetical protein